MTVIIMFCDCILYFCVRWCVSIVPFIDYKIRCSDTFGCPIEVKFPFKETYVGFVPISLSLRAFLMTPLIEWLHVDSSTDLNQEPLPPRWQWGHPVIWNQRLKFKWGQNHTNWIMSNHGWMSQVPRHMTKTAFLMTFLNHLFPKYDTFARCRP